MSNYDEIVRLRNLIDWYEDEMSALQERMQVLINELQIKEAEHESKVN